MRFAHIADCHLGGWREPKLRLLGIKAFAKSIDLCIEKQMDFVIIAGDLFNTSVPSIDSLKATVDGLRKLRDNNIMVYLVPGSHDFSPSGKTILDVLESAGLVINVAKGEETEGKLRLNFTVDPKTKAMLTGLPGKKGALESSYYEALDREHLESSSKDWQEKSYKIFVFHSALSEYKPKEMEGMECSPISILPKNFDYYAAGHVHYVFSKKEPGYGLIAFPGPIFPNNFKELEELGRGGFYIVDTSKEDYPEWQPVQVANHSPIKLDCNGMTTEQVTTDLLAMISKKEFPNTIITIRLFGKLKSGKPRDIDFAKIFHELYQKSAYFVMKNTSKLVSEEFEEIKVEQAPVEEIESKLIKEHSGQLKIMDTEKEVLLSSQLISLLNREKSEGQRVADFEKHLVEDIDKILNID